MRFRPRRTPEPPPGDGGSDLATEALRHLDGLYATALRLTRDPDAAEDLVQDTFLRVLRFADRFERGTNLRAWLYTILHNAFRNRLRDAGRDPVEIDSAAVEGAPLTAGGRDDPEAMLLREALEAELRAALDELPAAYRQAVWLRDIEEFSYAEIAGILDLPIGTVMSRIARGRRLLLVRLGTIRES